MVTSAACPLPTPRLSRMLRSLFFVPIRPGLTLASNQEEVPSQVETLNSPNSWETPFRRLLRLPQTALETLLARGQLVYLIREQRTPAGSKPAGAWLEQWASSMQKPRPESSWRLGPGAAGIRQPGPARMQHSAARGPERARRACCSGVSERSPRPPRRPAAGLPVAPALPRRWASSVLPEAGEVPSPRHLSPPSP